MKLLLVKILQKKQLLISKTLGDKNITQNFIFDDGTKRLHIMIIVELLEKVGFIEPTKKIKIIFQNYTIDSMTLVNLLL